MRVLIVDDVTANRRLPEVVLRRAGHEVCSVDCGEAAIEAMDGAHFDVVLLDLTMPGLTGLDVCRHWREVQSRQDVRIVAYTAYVSEGEWDSILSVGFDHLVTKPASPADILRAVRHSGEDAASEAWCAPSGDAFPDQAAR